MTPRREVIAILLPFLVGCALGRGEDWLSPVGKRHPLAGHIWDVNAARMLDSSQLIRRLAARSLVLLGEKHDNADHHRLQARIVEGLVAAGRRPAVAFEMLSVDLDPVLTNTLARPSVTSDELRKAIRWDESGWPEWNLYAPVFEAALRAHLPIATADLSRSSIDSIRREGPGALDAALVAYLGLDTPLSREQRRALTDQIREAHCGHAPRHLIGRMVDVQRARDAHMARRLMDASRLSPTGSAVLIAGIEHVRRDWGGLLYLSRWAPEADIASVGFIEVLEGQTAPAETLAERYGASVPLDYVWFTPRVDDIDPCEKFKEHLQKMRERL
jgi:uncharacterized iron-regulated protein